MLTRGVRYPLVNEHGFGEVVEIANCMPPRAWVRLETHDYNGPALFQYHPDGKPSLAIFKKMPRLIVANEMDVFEREEEPAGMDF